MAGCLGVATMIVLIMILMITGIGLLFAGIINGMTVLSVAGLVVFMLSIVAIVILRKKYMGNSDAKELEYLKANPSVGILRVMHQHTSSDKIEYEILEGPSTKDEFCVPKSTNLCYWTTYMKAGQYKISAKFVIEKMDAKYRVYRTETEAETLTLNIEDGKYYEFYYDKKNSAYVFEEKEMAKDLHMATEIMKKAKGV